MPHRPAVDPPGGTGSVLSARSPRLHEARRAFFAIRRPSFPVAILSSHGGVKGPPAATRPPLCQARREAQPQADRVHRGQASPYRESVAPKRASFGRRRAAAPCSSNRIWFHGRDEGRHRHSEVVRRCHPRLARPCVVPTAAAWRRLGPRRSDASRSAPARPRGTAFAAPSLLPRGRAAAPPTSEVPRPRLAAVSAAWSAHHDPLTILRRRCLALAAPRSLSGRGA